MVHEYSGFGDTTAEVRADHTRVTGTNDCSVRPVLVDSTWCGKIRVAYDTATEDWLCRDTTRSPHRNWQRKTETSRPG